MSQEYLEHVYEPFSRGTRDSGTHYQGTGLGMAITKEIVDLMGGTIDVESRVGVATTFRIKVPFELGADEYVQQKDSGTETDISLEHMKILMAEDNELNIEIAMFMLEEAGAEVTVARNGKEAYLTWQNAPIDCYDVILMDIMMPEMNGIQAAECIRKSNRQDAGRIPIVAMTANAFAEDIKRCRAAGMNDHLAKPLDIQKLYRTLARYHRSAYSE